MRKCYRCNSCMKLVWYESQAYRVCLLCRIVFYVGTGEQVTHLPLLDAILNQAGTAV